MMAKVACVAALLLAACGGGSSSPDAAVALDGGLCEPNASRICQDGEAYYVDSCGNLGDRIEVCDDERACNEQLGACCFPVATEGAFMGAPVFTEVTWSAPAASAELAVGYSIATFSTGGQAQTLRYSTQIDDVEVLFGLRADLADSGTAAGEGIDFVAYIGSQDLANAETSAPTYANGGADGGGFVRLNRPTDLAPRTSIALRIVREEEQGEADWFAAYTTIDEGEEELMGRLLIPRASAGTPARLAGGSHLMYSGVLRDNAFTLADVGKVQVAVSVPTYDGDAATGASFDYPLLPPSDTPFPNADVTYDPLEDRVVVTQGGVSPKCSQPGELF
ncbi:MAG: hypothetical protein KJO07_00925 [Deltaproteobacteria bacterium]|nr:hypothetical protein [Deltaproteobacteria bacterium]